MSKARLFLISIAIVSLLTGCGGGGGNGTPKPPPLSSTVRQMQVGDTWIYTVMGTVESGGDSTPVSGTITKQITNQTITKDSATVRVVRWTGTVSGVGYTRTLNTSEYLTQDPDGVMWTYGGEDDGGVYWIESPATGRDRYVVSPMNIGTEWGSVEQLTGGTTVNRAFEVMARERIAVPAGSFDTFNVTGTGFFAGSPSTESLWWAPQIGAPVQMHIEAFDAAAGKDMILTFRLQSWSR